MKSLVRVYGSDPFTYDLARALAESEARRREADRRAAEGKERERWHRRMEDPAFRESERERHRRQVKISIGGSSQHVGYVPTPEAAEMLRAKIVAESPKATRQARDEWNQAGEDVCPARSDPTQP